MIPFLIQRCTVLSLDPAKADKIANVLKPEYMGSAEFEFGALPASLRAVFENWRQYACFLPGLKDKACRALFLFARKDQEAQVREAVRLASRERAVRTKEWVGLEHALNGYPPGQGYGGSKPDVWWDIEHHWFAILGEENANAVVNALRTLKDRWAAEGKIVAAPTPAMKKSRKAGAKKSA